MIAEFDNLHERSIGAHPCRNETLFLELFPVSVIEFVTMPMPLTDVLLAVSFERKACGAEPARPGTQPHRTASLVDILLLFHQ